MQLLPRWLGTGAGDSGSHPCRGGGPGVPAHPGEHCRLLGSPAARIPHCIRTRCWLPLHQPQATWLFGVPPPVLPCSCRLVTRPGADSERTSQGSCAGVLLEAGLSLGWLMQFWHCFSCQQCCQPGTWAVPVPDASLQPQRAAMQPSPKAPNPGTVSP